MNKLIKSRIQLCLIAAIGAAILLANPAPGLAQTPHAKRTPGPTRPTPPVQDGQLKSIQARANAAAGKLDFRDPQSVKQANAELAKVHADLVAYAKKNGLKVTTKEETKAVAPLEQRCDATANTSNKQCTLKGSYLGSEKPPQIHCLYDCVPIATQVKE